MNNKLTMEDIEIIINNAVQESLKPFLELQEKVIEALKEDIQLIKQDTKDIEDAKQMISDLKLNMEYEAIEDIEWIDDNDITKEK